MIQIGRVKVVKKRDVVLMTICLTGYTSGDMDMELAGQIQIPIAIALAIKRNQNKP